MSDQEFDIGDVIVLIGGTNEKFIVVEDVFGYGVHVNRVVNGHRDLGTALIPDTAKCRYIKVGEWNYACDKEIEDE